MTEVHVACGLRIADAAALPQGSSTHASISIRVELYNQIATGTHCVAGGAADAAAQQRQASGGRICLNERVPHCLEHPAVQLIRGDILRQQVAQRHNLRHARSGVDRMSKTEIDDGR